MKRDDLKKLGLEDSVIDTIMESNGKDIEKHKTANAGLTAELETLKTQLTEAGAQIESFKGLKVEDIQKAADDYKAKFEEAEKNRVNEIAALKFGYDFDGALTGAKVKYKNEVISRLKVEELKDEAGNFNAERFTEQIGKIKPEAPDLFADVKEPPKVVLPGNNQPIQDKTISAAREAAGLNK